MQWLCFVGDDLYIYLSYVNRSVLMSVLINFSFQPQLKCSMFNFFNNIKENFCCKKQTLLHRRWFSEFIYWDIGDVQRITCGYVTAFIPNLSDWACKFDLNCHNPGNCTLLLGTRYLCKKSLFGAFDVLTWKTYQINSKSKQNCSEIILSWIHEHIFNCWLC